MAVADLNSVVLVGRMTRDVNLTFTNAGLAIGEGAIAINHRPAKDKEPESSFIAFKFFGKFAETMSKYLTKGQQVAIRGYLKQERWQDKESGANRSKVVMIAEECELVGGKSNGDNAGSGDGFGYN